MRKENLDQFRNLQELVRLLPRYNFEGLSFDELMLLRDSLDKKIIEENQKRELKLETGNFYKDNKGNTWYCARRLTGHGLCFLCYYYDWFDRDTPFYSYHQESFDPDGTRTHNDYYKHKDAGLFFVEETETPKALKDLDIDSLIPLI